MATVMDTRSLECPLCLDRFDSEEKLPMVFRCGRTICRDCVFSLAEYYYGEAYCGLSGCKCNLPPEDVPVNYSLLGVLKTAPVLYNYVTDGLGEKGNHLDSASYPMSIQWLQEREEHFANSEKGLIDFTKMLSQLLITAKNGCVSIAVIGGTGVGKSSLINALRDIVYPGFGLHGNGKEASYAREGLSNMDGSLIPRSYSFSDLEMVNLWDLPGYGTNSRLISKRQDYLVDNLPETVKFHPNLYSSETYLEDIKVTMFDVYILVISDRLSSLDAQILEKLRDRKVFLVRMKLDSTLASKPAGMSVETFKAVLRGNTRSELETLYEIDWIRPDQIYLVSRLVDNKIPGNDIMRLRDDLRACLETPKQVLFDLATGDGIAKLKNMCDRVVSRRKDMLMKEDLHWARLRAAGLSMLPMGCVFVQKYVWKSYLKSFEQNFAIVNECMDRLAEVVGVRKNELLSQLVQSVKQRRPKTNISGLTIHDDQDTCSGDSEQRLISRESSQNEEKLLHRVIRQMNITFTQKIVNTVIGFPILSLPSNVYMSHAILNKAIERMSIMAITAYHSAIDAVTSKVGLRKQNQDGRCSRQESEILDSIVEENQLTHEEWEDHNISDIPLQEEDEEEVDYEADSEFSWSKYELEYQTEFSYGTTV